MFPNDVVMQHGLTFKRDRLTFRHINLFTCDNDSGIVASDSLSNSAAIVMRARYTRPYQSIFAVLLTSALKTNYWLRTLIGSMSASNNEIETFETEATKLLKTFTNYEIIEQC